MRIDYSEPRQAVGSASTRHGKPPRKGVTAGVLFVALFMFAVGAVSGFGYGWYLSQQSAKKAFKAAMEQQSLETLQKEQKGGGRLQPETAAQPLPSEQPAAATVGGAEKGDKGKGVTQAAPAEDVPLSFFESLPKGQKQTVLGSGINEKPKQQPTVAQPVAAPAAPLKPAVDSGVYLVQVASFSTQKDADAAKAKLATKGYSATIQEISLADKGVWYRVRVGHRLDKEAAMEIAGRIGGGAKVVPDQE